MDVLHYTTAQKQLEQTMDKVCDDRNPVIIPRNDKHSVVIMSLEDYQSLAETADLLTSPKNAKRLFESIAELEAVGGLKKELIE